jgi:ketosteroid isomerase-like protein
VKKLGYGVLGLLMILGSAVAQQKAATDEAALKAMEDKWSAANLKGDAAALSAIFADTFVSTESDGTVRTKAEVVGALKSGEIKFLASKSSEMKVFLYGDAGVVTGRWAGKFIVKGKTVDTVERFTDTYVRQNGQWRCVATQGTTAK